MGGKNSGPRTRPTAIQKLHGVTRKDRLNPYEPHPPAVSDAFDVPPPEIEHDDVAVSEWIRNVPMLRKLGVVTEADRSALIALCQQWSRYLAAHHETAERGMLIETETGVKPNPLIAIADRALAQCKALWGEFGLTPAARPRLKVATTPTDPAKDKWDGLLQ